MCISMYQPDQYTLASKLFIHLLGLIFFFAFFPFIFQIKGLMGKKGILPVANYLRYIKNHLGKRAYAEYPTIFWFDSSDRALIGTAIAGTVLSVLLFLGVFPPILIPLLYVLYISIIRVGQDFLSFGWELFLMEIAANAFLLSLTEVPNPFVWISINLLLFRFHLQAGAVKLQSGDVNWHNLTALCYHYQTQPIPNTTAWYAHKLPLWFQKVSCLAMLVIEIPLAFGVFGSPEMRLVVFFCFFGLQLFIWLTGNFSYLNYMTAVLSVLLISDHVLSPIMGPVEVVAPPAIWVNVLISSAAIALITLQIMRLWHHFFPNAVFERVLNKVYNYYIANRYGIFAVMTTKRYEIVIEGSDDGKTWKEYTFKYKPSEINRRPRRISPYQPRLDWQVWFLPFSNYQNEQWFQNFLHHLLKGTPEVLTLLRGNPFPNIPPKYVRTLMYDYVFSDAKTKKETGEWWKRTYVGGYSPILCLKRR
jgi:lipase maturation factor 1